MKEAAVARLKEEEGDRDRRRRKSRRPAAQPRCGRAATKERREAAVARLKEKEGDRGRRRRSLDAAANLAGMQRCVGAGGATATMKERRDGALIEEGGREGPPPAGGGGSEALPARQWWWTGGEAMRGIGRKRLVAAAAVGGEGDGKYSRVWWILYEGG
jgi:hypothetical protein